MPYIAVWDDQPTSTYVLKTLSYKYLQTDARRAEQHTTDKPQRGDSFTNLVVFHLQNI